MSDAEGRRPDLLESLLGLCEPDDVDEEPAAETFPAVERRQAPVASVAAPAPAGPPPDVATIVAGLQHADPAQRRGALALLAEGDPDLRSLARLGLTDVDD